MVSQYWMIVVFPLVCYLGGYALGRYHRRREMRKYYRLGDYVQGKSDVTVHDDR